MFGVFTGFFPMLIRVWGMAFAMIGGLLVAAYVGGVVFFHLIGLFHGCTGFCGS
jgi:hypothetical protein